LVKVSVIIPAYNVEKYIEGCVNSVINQSLDEIEIIIVNDGSTDKTLNVVSDIRKSSNKVDLINIKNSGVSEARNIGLSNSKGKYLFFLDGDDWIESNTLEELYNVAEEKKAQIVISNAYKDYGNGHVETLIDGKELSNDPVKELLTDNIIPSIWTKLYKRELFVNNSIKFSKGIKMGEDLLINFFLLYCAQKVIKIDEAYTHYMQRMDSVSNTYKEQVKDIYKVFNEIQYFLIKNNTFHKYKDEFYYCKFLHTYYFRVVKSNQLGPIHKELYDNWNKDIDTFKNNTYILNFLKGQKFHFKVIEKLYRVNYFLGLSIRKLMNFISQHKKKYKRQSAS